MLTNNVTYSTLRVVVEEAEEAFVGGFSCLLLFVYFATVQRAREVGSDSYKRDDESSAPVLKLDAVVCAHDALYA